MPRGRPPKESSFNRALNAIVDRAATDIAQAVRENIASEVARLVSGGPAGGLAPTVLRQAGRKRRVILCPVQGCAKPGGGPKWGWFCEKHKDLPAAEKEKARAASRQRPRLVKKRRGRKKK